MSAYQAQLEPRMYLAVQAGALKISEAWALQDLAYLVGPNQVLLLPPQLSSAVDRLQLLEQPTANSLPL